MQLSETRAKPKRRQNAALPQQISLCRRGEGGPGLRACSGGAKPRETKPQSPTSCLSEQSRAGCAVHVSPCLASVLVHISCRVSSEKNTPPGSRLFFSTKTQAARAAKAEAEDRRARLQAVLEAGARQVRNFSIIAHIDHGKSTLSDRLLEVTGTISRGSKAQFLDSLEVETTRGITVKAQTCSLLYRHPETGVDYLLNLIDTPGHSDFSHEVTRGLAVCQGAVLLVDGLQGIQAQTIAHFGRARQQDLKRLLVAINKVDLPAAPEQIPSVKASIASLTGEKEEEVLAVSAKTGQEFKSIGFALTGYVFVFCFPSGIDDLLHAIVEKIPPPEGEEAAPVKALIFDSWFDAKKGIIQLVALKEGVLKPRTTLVAAHARKTIQVKEVGILHPFMTPTKALKAGQVGYICSNIKRTQDACIGDTVFPQNQVGEPLPCFGPPKCTVYAGVYPELVADYEKLQVAIGRLLLTDPAVEAKAEVSAALGQGFRCGFLGILHLDVFKERLKTEHDMSVLVTSPTVPYHVTPKTKGQKTLIVRSASEFPDYFEQVEEPMVEATLLVPQKSVPAIQQLCMERRGEELRYECMSMHGGQGASDARQDSVLLVYRIPLAEVILDFFDRLQALTSGLVSFDYIDAGLAPADIVKVGFLFNGERVDALSFLAQRSRAREQGIAYTQRLAKLIPQHQFEVAIQCVLNGKVIAREVVRAAKKDVLAKCYGGDMTRKMKLLEKEKERKKKLRSISNVRVPPEAFFQLLKL
ncbi:GTP-binding protein LepA, related [Neospora caninum Liverpool]|uniref:Translation factor GUF1 homolog, mitochondrial n=1 Tax=Neospora caninum (strain Liverpool) TaxID=572307 RepID=F0VPJ1_NEOCL|nr:GTP-binding protein LepA, related [Neospora caninum Liverpool]CBZ55637.1 GTP-binding protein LepA, related [Neospora caninum Liverpool]|eukprot:XP_003885665.1 GTP-binding protein LepA, related [Neospora caninum Liverpool]